MKTFNAIGIDKELDWDRISHLMRIGLVAGIMVLIGDMLLGWGVSDPALSGIARKLSAYDTLPDSRIFWSAFLIFFIVQSIAHICAFVKGLTPYPRWCWIFCLPVGMAATMLLKLCGNHAVTNALTAGSLLPLPSRQWTGFTGEYLMIRWTEQWKYLPMMKLMLPGFLVDIIIPRVFSKSKGYTKECRKSRIDLDEHIQSTIREWINP